LFRVVLGQANPSQPGTTRPRRRAWSVTWSMTRWRCSRSWPGRAHRSGTTPRRTRWDRTLALQRMRR